MGLVIALLVGGARFKRIFENTFMKSVDKIKVNFAMSTNQLRTY